jgi:hypothetical protein
MLGAFQAAMLGMTRDAANDIGVPGGAGFGVGVCPGIPAGFSALTGTAVIGHDDYGNYQYADESVMVWVPAFYYRIGHASNPTYATYGVNSIDVKAESFFANEAAANAAGYALHRAFKDGGATKRGFMVDKYMCSRKALGSGFIASSIKNGNPISAHADHNPMTGLTACSTNNYYQAFNAAHARDGVNGAANANSIFFPGSRFVSGALALLSMAHGQAAGSTANCAWYSATTTNFPKGCNNNALGDTNDTAVKWQSDGYSNCGKTGSAGYGGGAGNVFAKSTHNGQNCGIADLNGLMWEISPGISSIAATVAIAGMTRANPCVVTWVGHGQATGAVVMPLSITQTGWVGLKDKLFSITRVDDDRFSLDGVDSSGFAADYDPVTDPGTIFRAAFYTAKEAVAMRTFTGGNSAATDHWGATGIAAMMDAFAPAFETTYPNNGTTQRFGDGAGQVLSEATSGAGWLKSGLGFPVSLSGISAAGTNLFGIDYYYQYLFNDLCLLSSAYWAYTTAAGVWAANWTSSREYASISVGFRLACYPV